MSPLEHRRLAEHYSAGLILGAYSPPESVPSALAGHDDLVILTRGLIAMSARQWPVDIGALIDGLAARGDLERVGGIAALRKMMAKWDKIVTRAHILGAIEVACRDALAAHQREAESEYRALLAISEWNDNREDALDCLAALEALVTKKEAA
jgi:hypothetical protein